MTPEKLNLWDRFFNRYTKVAVDKYFELRRQPAWYCVYDGEYYPARNYRQYFVVYKITDRLTGSERYVDEPI